MSLIRQHLIDPDICIRCNTCEETCPRQAVTHNDDNYVVDAAICRYCMDCISPCPTGAIDNWRMVSAPYTIEQQFGWDELPEERLIVTGENDGEAAGEAVEDEAAQILELAHRAEGGKAVPPFSAAHPYVNVYTRDNPLVATVTGNVRITGDGASADIHHIILDLGAAAFPVLEGQSIGIRPPGTDERGKAHRLRLYSVSSPRDGERPNHNNLALTVKRVVYERDGRPCEGVASGYLCGLRRGDTLKVTGPFGNTFLMPNHDQANIIMICTGTGAAPFRAMTERRRRRNPGAAGSLMLLFGARTPDELPYFGPLMKLPDSLIDRELVFSRLEGKPKEYVQDRMRARSADIARLLASEHTFVFVCGLKGMEQGVDEAFSAICEENDLDWPALSAAMRRNGRYHIETY